MKILSSQTIGVAKPSPGTFTFHLPFFPWARSVGGELEGAKPLPVGPRHCGQFSVSRSERAARAGWNISNPTTVASETEIPAVRAARARGTDCPVIARIMNESFE